MDKWDEMSRPNLAYDDGQLGLFTDLYELTMGQAYFSQGMHQQATFNLNVRSYPPNRGYLVSAGLDDVLDYLSRLHFNGEAIRFLRSTGMFTDDFLDYLRGVRFTGSVRAIPEGRLFFADEPLLEITAPIIEAQLAETYVINQMNLQTTLATKGGALRVGGPGKGHRRFRVPAHPRLRRGAEDGPGPATSPVLRPPAMSSPPATTASRQPGRWPIPSSPASPRNWTLSAPTPAASPTAPRCCWTPMTPWPGHGMLVAIAKELEANGQRLVGVRLDSGDYAKLSQQVRRVLDDNGLNYVRILVSGGLDEYQLESLVSSGAPVDLFGVGTKAGRVGGRAVVGYGVQGRML